jgi:hypothetical protein
MRWLVDRRPQAMVLVARMADFSIRQVWTLSR